MEQILERKSFLAFPEGSTVCSFSNSRPNILKAYFGSRDKDLSIDIQQKLAHMAWMLDLRLPYI